MNILCDRMQLTDALAVAAGVAPLKTPKEILKNVLITAEGDSVSLFATDLEMSVRLGIDSVKVKKPGSVLVPVREAHALLREINDPTVVMESNEQRTTLRAGGGSFVLLGEDPSQYPKQVAFADEETVSVAATQFADLARRTAFAAAREDSRYAISGVLVECKDSTLRMVATDGRRLALSYCNVEGSPPNSQMIVPLRALQALIRAIPEANADALSVSFSTNQAGFALRRGSRSEFVMVTQLLDRRFPDYEAVIPRSAETTAEISRSQLEANLRRVAVMSGGEVKAVRFQLSSSSLAMSGENARVGRGDATMEVDVKGAGGSICFNPDFVLEALKVSDLDTVRFDMTDEETPAKFTLGEAFTYVVMPISNA